MPFSRQDDWTQGCMCILGCQCLFVSNFPVSSCCGTDFPDMSASHCLGISPPSSLAWANALAGQKNTQENTKPEDLLIQEYCETGIQNQSIQQILPILTDLFYDVKNIFHSLNCELDWVTQLDHFNIFLLVPGI